VSLPYYRDNTRDMGYSSSECDGRFLFVEGFEAVVIAKRLGAKRREKACKDAREEGSDRSGYLSYIRNPTLVSRHEEDDSW